KILTTMMESSAESLRVVLLGNRCSLKNSVGNMILGGNIPREPDCCQKISTYIDNKKIILINTPDLHHPNLCGEKLTKFGKDLMIRCDPGPHLFLLVLQPENFTEEEKERLQFILQTFDSPSNHTLTLISSSKEETSDVRKKYLQDPLMGDFLLKNLTFSPKCMERPLVRCT
uniref:AIG1-type G domain-containing protein n=1 Tax=Oryzias latipes TaxID=8090 RepID=A0A3P9L1D4_ORYLA